MISITAQALYKYFIRLLSKEKIITLIKTMATPFVPSFNVHATCGINYGGLAWDASAIEISSWILADAKEAKRVVRHELAHLIHYHIETGGRPHGKEFISVLKVIAPNTWRRDRHFRFTSAMYNARKLIHPGDGSVNVLPYRFPFIRQEQLVYV